MAVTEQFACDIAGCSLEFDTEPKSELPLDQLQSRRLVMKGLLTKTLDTRERRGISGALVFRNKKARGHYSVPLGKQSR